MTPASDGTQQNCRNCTWRQRCLPAGLEGDALDRFEQTVARRIGIERNGRLFNGGDRFELLYAIQKGEFKTECAAGNGMQVTSFGMPGDLLGMDGVGTGHHCGNAIALANSVVCVLPYADLSAAMNGQPALMRQFHVVLGRELARQQAMMLMLGHARATQRMATFLLDMRDRYTEHGEGPRMFKLSMSREDIGTYLGLTTESVSRLLSAFRQSGLLQVNNRAIELCDETRLREMAENGEPPLLPAT